MTIDRQNEIWPNFFIVGAPKAGTTSLYEYLKQIPGVFMSRVKEPCYFLSPIVQQLPRVNGRAVKSKKEYLELFKAVTNEKAIGEASPFYLWDSQSAVKIHQAVPKAKIIILLREPIDRAFSYYLMMLREGYESQPFNQAIKRDFDQAKSIGGKTYLYVEAGLYYFQIKRYIETFGFENVQVLFFEHFIKNVRSSVLEVLNFLNVESKLPAAFDESAHNSYAFSRARPLTRTIIDAVSDSKVLYKISQTIPPSVKQVLMAKVLTKEAPKPEIDQDSRTFLESIYTQEIPRLESIINQKVPWGSNLMK